MEPVERSGKNPEEILKVLSREWECLPEDIKYEVVQEGARGVMGIGAKDYVLKAWPPSNATLQPPPRPAASEKRGERAERGGDEVEEDNRGNLREPGEARAARPPRPRESDPQVLEKARSILEQLIQNIFSDAKVSISPEEGGTLEIEGDTGGLLIGRRGQTLDALQFLLNKMVYREDVGSSPRIQIDVGGYRARRAEALENLAVRMASKAKQMGRPIRLEPMAAHERRIIHVTLQEQQGIRTESEGEGEHKRVVIIPDRPSRGRGGRPGGASRGRGRRGGPPGQQGRWRGGRGNQGPGYGNERPPAERYEGLPADIEASDEPAEGVREDGWRQRVTEARARPANPAPAEPEEEEDPNDSIGNR